MAAGAPPIDRPRGAARRLALIEATVQILAEVGADAVTHRRVAEVAELPLASTTYWFDSKEELLIAALQVAAERDVARLRTYATEARDAEDPISAAIAAIVDPVDVKTPGGRASLLASYTLLLEAARRPILRDLSREWTEAYLEALSPMLARAGSRRPRGDAELLLAAADGLLFEQLSVAEAADPTPRLRRLAEALVGES